MILYLQKEGIMEQKCPECHSKNVIHFGYKYLKDGDYPRFQCKDCRHVFYIKTGVWKQ